MQKKRRFVEAAQWVRELYNGQPVPARLVGERMGITPMGAHHRLARVQEDGLVRALNAKGWVPLPEPAEAVN